MNSKYNTLTGSILVYVASMVLIMILINNYQEMDISVFLLFLAVAVTTLVLNVLYHSEKLKTILPLIIFSMLTGLQGILFFIAYLVDGMYSMIELLPMLGIVGGIFYIIGHIDNEEKTVKKTKDERNVSESALFDPKNIIWLDIYKMFVIFISTLSFVTSVLLFIVVPIIENTRITTMALISPLASVMVYVSGMIILNALYNLHNARENTDKIVELLNHQSHKDS